MTLWYRFALALVLLVSLSPKTATASTCYTSFEHCFCSHERDAWLVGRIVDRDADGAIVGELSIVYSPAPVMLPATLEMSILTTGAKQAIDSGVLVFVGRPHEWDGGSHAVTASVPFSDGKVRCRHAHGVLEVPIEVAIDAGSDNSAGQCDAYLKDRRWDGCADDLDSLCRCGAGSGGSAALMALAFAMWRLRTRQRGAAITSARSSV